MRTTTARTIRLASPLDRRRHGVPLRRLSAPPPDSQPAAARPETMKIGDRLYVTNGPKAT